MSEVTLGEDHPKVEKPRVTETEYARTMRLLYGQVPKLLNTINAASPDNVIGINMYSSVVSGSMDKPGEERSDVDVAVVVREPYFPSPEIAHEKGWSTELPRENDVGGTKLLTNNEGYREIEVAVWPEKILEEMLQNENGAGDKVLSLAPGKGTLSAHNVARLIGLGKVLYENPANAEQAENWRKMVQETLDLGYLPQVDIEISENMRKAMDMEKKMRVQLEKECLGPDFLRKAFGDETMPDGFHTGVLVEDLRVKIQEIKNKDAKQQIQARLEAFMNSSGNTDILKTSIEKIDIDIDSEIIKLIEDSFLGKARERINSTELSISDVGNLEKLNKELLEKPHVLAVVTDTLIQFQRTRMEAMGVDEITMPLAIKHIQSVTELAGRIQHEANPLATLLAAVHDFEKPYVKEDKTTRINLAEHEILSAIEGSEALFTALSAAGFGEYAKSMKLFALKVATHGEKEYPAYNSRDAKYGGKIDDREDIRMLFGGVYLTTDGTDDIKLTSSDVDPSRVEFLRDALRIVSGVDKCIGIRPFDYLKYDKENRGKGRGDLFWVSDSSADYAIWQTGAFASSYIRNVEGIPKKIQPLVDEIPEVRIEKKRALAEFLILDMTEEFTTKDLLDAYLVRLQLPSESSNRIKEVWYEALTLKQRFHEHKDNDELRRKGYSDQFKVFTQQIDFLTPEDLDSFAEVAKNAQTILQEKLQVWFLGKESNK